MAPEILYCQLLDRPPEKEGMILYKQRSHESRVDLGSMSIPVEYIKANDMDNVDKIIDLFANQICIDPKEPLHEDINCLFIIPTPKCSCCTNLTSIVLLKAKSVNGQLCGHPFICLLGSSSTGCIQNKHSLPFGIQTTTTPHKIIQTITQGVHSSDQVVFINDIQLPMFVNQ